MLMRQVVSKQIHITKRDLFYTDVKLFGKQEESDSVLDDMACMLGCTRTSLNVVASDKGVSHVHREWVQRQAISVSTERTIHVLSSTVFMVSCG